MKYRLDRYGNSISQLGYGCMRFTRKGTGIDYEKAEKEVLLAIEQGISYFDTAYIYPGSEECLGQILEKNKCRNQVYIATKLPQYVIRSSAAIDKIFHKVGCTGCRYCMPCPKGVDVPGNFYYYNLMYMEKRSSARLEFAKNMGLRKEPGFASQCVGCGLCETHCPQHIKIREKLKEADRGLRPLPYKLGIHAARNIMLR